MPSPPPRAVGIPWYRREDYGRILDVMVDRHVLPDTFEEWRKKAGGLESHYRSQGVLTVRAVIDPGEFTAWCRARGLNVDAQGRMAFANEAAFARFGQTH